MDKIMNQKYLNAIEELENTGLTKMKCFGHSMTPILKSGSLITFKKESDYQIGDIVFCKVKGTMISGHKITKKSHGSYMIANNHGHENGWTRTIYGKVISS